MNLEINAEESGILISALTCKLVRLQMQRDIFVSEDRPQWVADVDREIFVIFELKDRLFK